MTVLSTSCWITDHVLAGKNWGNNDLHIQTRFQTLTIDNLVKFVLNVLNEQVNLDYKQICQIHAHKVYRNCAGQGKIGFILGKPTLFHAWKRCVERAIHTAHIEIMQLIGKLYMRPWHTSGKPILIEHVEMFPDQPRMWVILLSPSASRCVTFQTVHH